MNNNQQQQGYQQQGYQQQGYQQPNYQQQPYYPPKAPKDVSGMINKVTGMLTFVFLGIAAAALVIGFILSIVCAASKECYMPNAIFGASGWFADLLNGCAYTISIVAKYLFYAGIVAALQKLTKK